MDHAKLLDVLTSHPISHAILPRAVCFATSRPANYAHVVTSAAVDWHLSQSEDVYLDYTIKRFIYIITNGYYYLSLVDSVNITISGDINPYVYLIDNIYRN